MNFSYLGATPSQRDELFKLFLQKPEKFFESMKANMRDTRKAIEQLSNAENLRIKNLQQSIEKKIKYCQNFLSDTDIKLDQLMEEIEDRKNKSQEDLAKMERYLAAKLAAEKTLKLMKEALEELKKEEEQNKKELKTFLEKYPEKMFELNSEI